MLAPDVPVYRENTMLASAVAWYISFLVKFVYPLAATFEVKTLGPIVSPFALTIKYTSVLPEGLIDALPSSKYFSPAFTLTVISVPDIFL